MSTRVIAFHIEDEESVSRILERLGEGFHVRRRAPADRTAIWYDTFDRRLQRAHATLSVSGEASDRLLVWTPNSGGAERRQAISGAPGFAEDVPKGPIRDALAPVIEKRRLLPQAQLQDQAHVLDVLDAEEKTVARVSVRIRRARPASASTPPSGAAMNERPQKCSSSSTPMRFAAATKTPLATA